MVLKTAPDAIRAIHLPLGRRARGPRRCAEHGRRSGSDYLQPAKMDAAGAQGEPDDSSPAVHAGRPAGFLRPARIRAACSHTSDRLAERAGAVPRVLAGAEATEDRRTRTEANASARARSDVRLR